MCVYGCGCVSVYHILLARVDNLVCFMHIEVHVFVCLPHLRRDNVVHSTGEHNHYRSRNPSLEATALHVVRIDPATFSLRRAVNTQFTITSGLQVKPNCHLISSEGKHLGMTKTKLDHHGSLASDEPIFAPRTNRISSSIIRELSTEKVEWLPSVR